MLRYVVAAMCGVSLTGSVYMAGFGPQARQTAGDECPYCVPNVPVEKTIDMTGKTDMKNTKCIVMVDDIGKSTHMVEYKGKVYHTCCPDCIEEFNKNPEKFVKLFEADPAKYGVK